MLAGNNGQAANLILEKDAFFVCSSPISIAPEGINSTFIANTVSLGGFTGPQPYTFDTYSLFVAFPNLPNLKYWALIQMSLQYSGVSVFFEATLKIVLITQLHN